MSRSTAFPPSLALVFLAAACAPGGTDLGTSRGSGGGDGGTATGEDGYVECMNGEDDDGDGLADCSDDECADFCTMRPDAGPPVDAGLDECATVAVEAETTLRPVDIIWVVDSSGSMENEAARVQEHMNEFASDILAAGIDPHVVVITDHDYITVPPPLGTDPEHYLFVDRHVGSNEPLERLIDQWDRYGHFLREDAVTHIVAVTDDESDMSDGEFDVRMTGLLGHEYTLHAIASEDDGGRECDGAADIGRRYYNLADLTGGLKISICTRDWTAVFDRLRERGAEPAPPPCDYAVPDPPMDEELDFMRVNVQYTPGSGGATQTFPYVESEASCGGTGGWYYDDPSAPSEVRLCPSSCTLVGMDTDGSVSIALGCATRLM